MKNPKSNGIQKRIDFFGRWALAFFAVLAVLIGWLGGRYEAEKFGVVFEIGVGGGAALIVASFIFAAISYKHISRLEALEND